MGMGVGIGVWRLDGAIPFRTERTEVSHSAHGPAVGLCICSHLPQEQ